MSFSSALLLGLHIFSCHVLARPSLNLLSPRQGFEWEYVPNPPNPLPGIQEAQVPQNNDMLTEMSFMVETWFENLNTRLEAGEVHLPGPRQDLVLEDYLYPRDFNLNLPDPDIRIHVLFAGTQTNDFVPPNLDAAGGDIPMNFRDAMGVRHHTYSMYTGVGPDGSNWMAYYQVQREPGDGDSNASTQTHFSDEDSHSVQGFLRSNRFDDPAGTAWTAFGIGAGTIVIG